MKRILILFILLTCFSFVKAQNQIYSNNKEGVSFSYSNNFKKASIQSAKHMLLKLESGTTTIALSKWNYGIDESYTIWDEDIVQLTKDNINNSGTSVISFDKRYVNTKSGKKKALVAITYSSSVNIHLLTYQFLHKGNLIQVVVSNRGKYDKGMLATYDKYVSGLQIK